MRRLSKTAILLSMILTWSLLSTMVTATSDKNFGTHLSGDNEVPPVETLAQGQAIFKLSKDGTELYYKLIVANIENVMMSHIHIGGPDENGPVAVWLYPDSPPPILIPGSSNGVLAEGIITEGDLVGPLPGMTMNDLLAEIKAGNTYVNVHTEQNPAGEIRGQISSKTNDQGPPGFVIPETPIGTISTVLAMMGAGLLISKRKPIG